jgi:hypothetical protein
MTQPHHHRRRAELLLSSRRAERGCAVSQSRRAPASYALRCTDGGELRLSENSLAGRRAREENCHALAGHIWRNRFIYRRFNKLTSSFNEIYFTMFTKALNLSKLLLP